MKTFVRFVVFAWTALLAASIVPAAAQDPGRLKLSTVVIDPGHGGHDSGCVSQDRKTYEKNIALDISRRLAKKIRDTYPGVKVILTRDEDKYVTLSGRADIANNAGADLFISIHINAQAKGTSANGYSIHCLGQSAQQGNDLFGKNLELCKRENSVILLEDDYKTKYQGFDPTDPQSYIFFSLMQNAHLEHSLIFAEDIASAMKGGPIARSRGVSQDPFWVLWRTTMPSVLVEVGFISNPADLKVMRSPEGRDRIAGNLLKAFSTFKNRYDGSTGGAPETAPVTNMDDKEEPAPAADVKRTEVAAPAGGEEGVTYGIQVLATSRKMKADDPFFRGYPVKEVQVGSLYKYVLRPVTDEADARVFYKQVSKNFPGCFLVRSKGETLERIR